MTHIKICGLQDFPTSLAALKAGAQYLGFNFVPTSVRLVDAENVVTIIQKLRAVHSTTSPKMVGVFANQPPVYINAVSEFCGLDMVQLSGDEPIATCKYIARPVIKVIKVNPGAQEEHELLRIRHMLALTHIQNVLPMLDRYDLSSHGGTGKTVNWNIAKALAEDQEFFLAGGLSPDNISMAISLVHPWGVDVASGVETNGVKDIRKIRQFIQRTQES